MKGTGADEALCAGGQAEKNRMPEQKAGSGAQKSTAKRVGKRETEGKAAKRTGAQETAGGTARRSRKIAAADEILEYLTGVMREGDTKDGFHAAELLGKHYSLFSDGARGESTAVTIINDVSR